MKIGVVSDSLANLSLDELLDVARSTGIEGIEVNTGNWSSSPHVNLTHLVTDGGARRKFIQSFERHGLDLIALNANGNQLHPTDGRRQTEVLHQTIELAGKIGVKKICLMSGLPGGSPEDKTPNWIVSSWPPETQTILKWQWNERLVPYWRELVSFAKLHGVEKLCVELHGNQLVYNVPSLHKLRDAVGETVGANLDPSHLMWMGADPLSAVDALKGAIHHVHAKDTYLNEPRQAVRSLLENGPLTDVADRAWSYVTLGYGHAESWWQKFVYRLRMAGYDDWLSIEHEDVLLSNMEGVRKSVKLLTRVSVVEQSSYEPQQI